MSYSIHLSDGAYRAYQRRAEQVGMTVDEYLEKNAPGDDGFALTPEMRAGIERGLAQADAGQLVGYSQVRESLSQYRAEWRESNSN